MLKKLIVERSEKLDNSTTDDDRNIVSEDDLANRED